MGDAVVPRLAFFCNGDRMKAQHRHQLHTNALADRMGRLLQGMRSAPKSTSTLLWVFVVLGLATFAVWQFAASASVNRSALWTSVDEAMHAPSAGPGGLQAIEKDNPGTIAARTAGFQLARWKLQQGLESVAGDDRTRALPLLVDARKLYKDLEPRCIDVPLLAQEAMMGKATAEESLAGIVESSNAAETTGTEKAGSLDQALEYYRELAKRFPESVLGKKAEKRANELEQQTSRAQIDQFYAEANKKAAPKVITPDKGK
jgi:hypothetical protein